ncbi:MAG: hypothetical protein AB1349_13320 [Elusimicrobiota bacterium]
MSTQQKLKLMIFIILIFFKFVIFVFSDEVVEIGIILGKPTGIAGKYFVSNKNAIDCSIGFDASFLAHFDYLWHNFEHLKVSECKLPFYYGGGILIAEKDFCIQGKLGLEYLFETNPLGVFIEIAPAVGTNFIFQGSVGVRYRLK